MKRVWLCAGAVIAACLILVSSAGAARWVGQLPPTVPTANGELEATSCPAADSCEAVGSYVSSTGWQLPLAQAWHGTGWSAQTIAAWPGATSARFGALSCIAAGWCMAVGTYATSAGGGGSLAEAFNGSNWTRDPVAAGPGGAAPVLTAVSCTAATACTAVGYYTSGSSGSTAGLVERWDGTGWTLQTPAAPPGAASWSLTGVSCRASTACTASGGSVSAQHADTALAETFAASSWHLASLTLPADSASSDLDAVACSATTACTAVGHYLTSDFVTRFFAERRTGNSWALQSMPAPSLGGSLASISCPTATSCTAVGNDGDQTGRQRTLADTWNGTAWTRRQTPTPGPGGHFSGVSCTAASACTAVGGVGAVGAAVVMPFDSARRPRVAATQPAFAATATVYGTVLVQRFNGSTWSQQTAVNQVGATPSDLDGGVSCSAPDACTAVGTYFSPTTGAFRNLAERWNGTDWTVQAVPDTPHETDSFLTGVSCSAANACMAIGTYDVNQFVNFSATWDGAHWTLNDMPIPSGATIVTVAAVSCTAADACTAVGDYTSGAKTLPLVERWNGSTWSQQSITAPAGSTYFVLTGVSCTTGGCVALGSGASGPSVAERSTGGAWTAHDLDETVLEVSCAALTACAGVGQTPGAGSSAEQLAGTTWAPEPVPSDLFALSVSCGSSSACEAVGADTAAGWDGSAWTEQTLGQPQGSGADGLRAVSCAAAAACLATGVLDRTVPIPLAQHYS